MRNEGQTVLEFSISLVAIVLTITGAGWLLRVQWQRAKCAYVVFEQTHAHLTGAVSWNPFSGVQVQVREGPDSVSGDGKCGSSSEQAHEHVALKKLESVRWE